MKGSMHATLLLSVCLLSGCGTASRGDTSAAESAPGATSQHRPTATVYDEVRTVTLRDPYMQHAEALTIDCLPGWQLVGKIDV